METLGSVDRHIIYSVYFHDPNGVRLELTAPTSPRWNDNAAAARAGLDDWEAVKERARRTGNDMATVLADLTRERSHRRARS